MTARALYDKHSRALYTTRRYRWDHAAQRTTRVYPVIAPVTWEFLSDDDQRYWTELARLVTPRKAMS